MIKTPRIQVSDDCEIRKTGNAINKAAAIRANAYFASLTLWRNKVKTAPPIIASRPNVENNSYLVNSPTLNIISAIAVAYITMEP